MSLLSPLGAGSPAILSRSALVLLINITLVYPVLLYIFVSRALLALFLVFAVALAFFCVRFVVLFPPALYVLQVDSHSFGMLIHGLAWLTFFHPLLLAAQYTLMFHLCCFSRSWC